MSKTCQEAIELMNLYLDGGLSGGQYPELEEHLANCEHCRKRMTYLRVISSEIRFDRPKMPDNLHGKIMAHIATQTAPKPRKEFPVKKLIWVAAVLAAMLMVVFLPPVVWATPNIADGNDPQRGNQSGIIGDTIQWWKALFAGEDGGEDPPETQDPSGSEQRPTDPSGSQTDQPGSIDRTEGAYTVPALRSEEVFAAHIIATGVVETDLSEWFDLRSVAVYPEDGSIYVYLPNEAGALANAYSFIRHLGLTLHLNPKGLPRVDANAPEVLFVIFPK